MGYIIDFSGVGRDDVAVAGGKGAGLGELVRAGLPVPCGFLLNTAAYELYVRDNGLDRILAVSQFYHLPRIKLAYARAGVDAWTVPARTSITRTTAIVSREIPAFWLYYLRAVMA